MVNVQELQKALDFVVSDLKNWNQGVWAYNESPTIENDTAVATIDCGTSFCLAGASCLTNDYVFVGWHGQTSFDFVVPKKDLSRYLDKEEDPVAESNSADGVARELMDLNEDQADHLFSGSNSLIDLFAWAEIISNHQIVVPEVVPAYQDKDGDVVAENSDFQTSVHGRVAYLRELYRDEYNEDVYSF